MIIVGIACFFAGALTAAVGLVAAAAIAVSRRWKQQEKEQK